jgi:hypothetical protein
MRANVERFEDANAFGGAIIRSLKDYLSWGSAVQKLEVHGMAGHHRAYVLGTRLG